jgi:hypothetical protein
MMAAPARRFDPRYGEWHNRHACLTINRGASQADRAVRERAGGRKPPDRAVMHGAPSPAAIATAFSILPLAGGVG